MDKGSCCGLAASAGDSNNVTAEVLAEQTFVHFNRNGVLRSDFEKLRGTRNVCITEDHIRVDKVCLIMASHMNRDWNPLKLFQRWSQLIGGLEVGHRYSGPATDKEQSVAKAAAQ